MALLSLAALYILKTNNKSAKLFRVRNTDLDGNEYFFDLVFSSTDLILQEILPRIILQENVSDCMPISPN